METAGTPTSPREDVRNSHQPREDVRNFHQSEEDVVVLAHLLALLLHCVPASVQNVRELSLSRLRIVIFKLEVALLAYYLLGIPRTQVEM